MYYNHLKNRYLQSINIPLPVLKVLGLNPNGVTKKKERLPTESQKSDGSLMTFSRMRSEKCSEGLGFESQRSHKK